jgi:hypothetical protein
MHHPPIQRFHLFNYQINYFPKADLKLRFDYYFNFVVVIVVVFVFGFLSRCCLGYGAQMLGFERLVGLVAKLK